MLLAYENPCIAEWARHKKQPVIAASLNKFCLIMDHNLFDVTRRYTNAVKQSANKLYIVSSRYIELVPAINK